MNFTVVNLSPEDKIAEYGNILKESIGEEIKNEFIENKYGNKHNYSHKYIEISEENQEIIGYVANILNKNGYKTVNEFNKTNKTIEFHYSFDTNSDENYLESKVDIHQEKEGDFENSNTLICYLTNTGIGGELGIYENINEESLHCKISTKSRTSLLPCVMFDYETWHRPLPFKGGERFAVSFHIKSE